MFFKNLCALDEVSLSTGRVRKGDLPVPFGLERYLLSAYTAGEIWNVAYSAERHSQ